MMPRFLMCNFFLRSAAAQLSRNFAWAVNHHSDKIKRGLLPHSPLNYFCHLVFPLKNYFISTNPVGMVKFYNLCENYLFPALLFILVRFFARCFMRKTLFGKFPLESSNLLIKSTQIDKI